MKKTLIIHGFGEDQIVYDGADKAAREQEVRANLAYQSHYFASAAHLAIEKAARHSREYLKDITARTPSPRFSSPSDVPFRLSPTTACARSFTSSLDNEPAAPLENICAQLDEPERLSPARSSAGSLTEAFADPALTRLTDPVRDLEAFAAPLPESQKSSASLGNSLKSHSAEFEDLSLAEFIVATHTELQNRPIARPLMDFLPKSPQRLRAETPELTLSEFLKKPLDEILDLKPATKVDVSSRSSSADHSSLPDCDPSIVKTLATNDPLLPLPPSRKSSARKQLSQETFAKLAGACPGYSVTSEQKLREGVLRHTHGDCAPRQSRSQDFDNDVGMVKNKSIINKFSRNADMRRVARMMSISE